MHCRRYASASADAEWLTGLSLMETALQDEPEDNPARNDLDQVAIDVANKLFQNWPRKKPANSLTASSAAILRVWDIFGGHYWHLHAMLRKFTGDDRGYHESRAVFVKEFRTFRYRFNVFLALCGPRARSRRSNHSFRRRRPNYCAITTRTGTFSIQRWSAFELATPTRPSRSRKKDVPHSSIARLRCNYGSHSLSSRTSTQMPPRGPAKSDRFVEDEFKACLEGSLKPVVREWLETVSVTPTSWCAAKCTHSSMGVPARMCRFGILLVARVLARMGRSRDAELAFAAALRLSNDGLELNKLTASIRAELSSRVHRRGLGSFRER